MRGKRAKAIRRAAKGLTPPGAPAGGLMVKTGKAPDGTQFPECAVVNPASTRGINNELKKDYRRVRSAGRRG